MARHEKGIGAGFHELPLVLFTALTTGGAGVGVAHVGLAFLGWVPWVPPAEVMIVLTTLLAVGLLFSLGHLGRPFRGPLALVRVGKSALSNEVLVVCTALVAGLLAVVLPSDHSMVMPLSLIAILSSVPVLLALGLVYRLPGQLMWKGMAPVHPLVLGMGFGLAMLLGTLPEGTRARGEFLILLVLMVDGLLVWERSWRISRSLRMGAPGHSSLMDQRGSALVLRILLGILLPAVALLSGWRELVVFSLFLNLLFDRFLFYGLAVRSTTEAEVILVEAALRARENRA
jgi:DMSO reductase anchor subunit